MMWWATVALLALVIFGAVCGIATYSYRSAIVRVLQAGEVIWALLSILWLCRLLP